MPRRVLDILMENFEIEDDALVRTSNRLGSGDWLELTRLQRHDLKDAVFVPRTVWGPNDVDEVFRSSIAPHRQACASISSSAASAA
jgi:hypothetical protein